jgi:RNA polymerase sigma-70 factor (ECF subfamily)
MKPNQASNMNGAENEFAYQLTDWQGRLLAYLVTLLGDLNDARDVLQETNLVLCRRKDECADVRDFGAWARKFAYFQALSFLRDRKRDRHVFDDEVLALIAGESGETPDEDLRLALRDCLSQLPERQRQTIARRYQENIPVRQLAADAGQKESAMKMGLMRIREALRVCIETKLREVAS